MGNAEGALKKQESSSLTLGKFYPKMKGYQLSLVRLHLVKEIIFRAVPSRTNAKCLQHLEAC
jgi:hypothetical protein